MRLLFPFTVSLALVAGSLCAVTPEEISLPELKYSNGVREVKYTNLKATKIEPDGIRFMHDGGFVKVPYENLPKAIQEKVGFDPAAASQHRLKADAANADALARGQAERTAAMKKEATAVSGEDAPRRPVTQADVKARWMVTCNYPISSLDREVRAKTAERDERLAAIQAGAFDRLAAKFAHQYNAWMYRQQGNEAAAAEEQEKIAKIEALESQDRESAALDRHASALQALAAALQNPYSFTSYR